MIPPPVEYRLPDNYNRDKLVPEVVDHLKREARRVGTWLSYPYVRTHALIVFRAKIERHPPDMECGRLARAALQVLADEPGYTVGRDGNFVSLDKCLRWDKPRNFRKITLDA